MIEPRVRFRILSDAQREAVHLAAMRVLEETGCEVQHPRGLEVLRSAGASVDGTRVRIGRELVDEALRRTPREIVLGDRDGNPVMTLAGDRVHFGTGSDCLVVREAGTGRRRPAVLDDVRRAARVAHALDEIDFVMSLACAADVPPERQYREQFAAMLLETTKPLVFTVVDPDELAPILAMSVAAQGGESAHRAAPHLLLYAEPVSPLVHPETSVTKLLFAGEHGVPVTYSPGSMGGGTAPVTGAGSVVLSTAEILSGLVLLQFAHPGSAFVFGGAIGPLDMTTMVNVLSAPFGASWTAALVEMGKRYGLPTWSLAGCSDAKLVDEQAAIDASLMILSAALSGANLVHDVGYLESGLAGSVEMLVMSAEVIRIVGRMLEGLDTSAEALAVEAIARVGPGGHYLTDAHTLTRLRRELFPPGLMDTRHFAAWRDAGASTLLDRVRAKTAGILADGTVPDLDPARRRRILDILAAP
ncbi:MAG TPA: trimethylamine methyltransferase family protein [Planctomycetota bacterium]|nr:trimethylamine methyltransferase family protein [Planctomycetota bacterium]